jgi:DNA polymerase I-like protein with 3'-5' exonuclease and polymerase domains
VSKFWYSLRYDKDKFSTLNQGTGVWVFDNWIREVLKRRRQLTATFHDEGVWEIKKGNKEKMEKLLREAVEAVNNKVKMNVKFGIDIKFGDSYADVH